MALSVSRGVYKSVSVASGQSVAGSETSGGAANLSLAATFANFTLAATATAVAPAAVGGGYPLWWPAYVRAELARQAAKREALALQLDEIRIVCPLPWAEAEVEAAEPPIAEVLAIVKLPVVHADGFVGGTLLMVIDHAEAVDDEALALLGAALLLAA